jgi:uncharacterized membrane protein YhaH (DUF805 family)
MDRDFAVRPGHVTPDFSARKGRTGERLLRTGPPIQAPAERPDRATRERERTMRRNRLAMRLVFLAAIWSLGLLAAALVLPIYNTTTVSADGTTFTTVTLVAGQGAWVLIPIGVPLVITVVVALALRRKRAHSPALSGRIAWAAVALLAAFAAFSILSIGGFVIPVAVALAAAARLTSPAAGSVG